MVLQLLLAAVDGPPENHFRQQRLACLPIWWRACCSFWHCGVSSPSTSRAGNRYGMIGMTIAVVTTLVTHFPMVLNPFGQSPAAIEHGLQVVPDFGAFGLILAAIALGGGIGWVTARKIAMTDMPQLVAAFHSLVGLAAVLVGWAAYLNPQAFGIVEVVMCRTALAQTGPEGTVLPTQIHPQSLIEMSLGIAIGAITFSGSVIAFLKLAGKMSGAPIMLPARHAINIVLLLAIAFFIFGFFMSQSMVDIALITALSFIIGFLLIIPIGGADMPVVVSMLNSYSGWAAAAMGFTLHNTAMIITGALVGSSGAILSYIMCKAMNRSFVSVIAGGFGAAADPAEARPRNSARGSAAAPRMRPSC
jgi:NAD(P) transhydrogenase subunit beta